MELDVGQVALNVIMVILGGGLLAGIGALRKAFAESKEKEALSNALDAKTPADIESVAVATMSSALTSAQSRITSLEQERSADKEYYQGIITDLKAQLAGVRVELASMEEKMRLLVADMDHKVNKEG